MRLPPSHVWFEEHGPALGLPLGLVVAVSLGGFAMALMVPLERGQPLDSVVQYMGLREREEGSFPVAVIATTEGPATVRLNRHRDLRRGDAVRLWKARTLLNRRYVLRRPGC